MRIRTEYEVARDEARRALFESFNDRRELAAVAAAASEGPLRFAERLRMTEFGARGVDPSMTRDDYVEHVFGEGARFGDAYSSAYLAAWQALAPFVARLH